MTERTSEELAEDAQKAVCRILRGIMAMKPSALLILRLKINRPGISNEEIARELRLKKKTVQNIVSEERLLRRMGL